MKYLKVWTDLYKAIEPFSDTEKGRLFTAMLIYAEQGIEPEFRGNERFIWPTIKAEIGRQREAYEHQCEVNRVNVTNRYEPLRVVTSGNESKQEKTKEKTKEKTEDKEREKKNFTPPTQAEVKAYCKERRNNINPKRFIAWYTAYGWQRNGQPVEDWKALIQTWEDDEPYQDGEPKKSKYANVKVN